MQIRPLTLEDAEFLQRSEGNPKGFPSQMVWIMKRLKNKAVRDYIGHIDGHPLCWGSVETMGNRTDELRWKVQWRADRGKGYGKAFARLLLERTKTKRVMAVIATDNIASMRIAIGLGMKPEYAKPNTPIVFTLDR